MTAGEAGPQRADALIDSLREAEPLLRSLARRMCRDEHDADDLVQDTFEHALRADVEIARANPRAYLVVILKNLFIDRCRALARQPGVMPLGEQVQHVATADSTAEPAWSRVSIGDVKAALDEIEADFRRVYEMHVFERRSYEDIARALGIQRLTVGSRLTRARQRLRAVLSRKLGEEAPR
jgi:RNA polymerase sigma-70 factor (ECF subfamily)